MKRWSFGLLLFALSTSAAYGQDDQLAARVWVPSLNGFRIQTKVLLEQMGLASTAESFDGLVKAKIGPKGFAGIDSGRPIGAYLRFDPDPSVGLTLPIGPEKDFFDLLDRLDIKSVKENDGTYRLGVAVPVPVYAKFSEQHAWITFLNKNAFAAKFDPVKAFPQESRLISARLRVDLIPNDARQLAISHFEDQLQDAAKKNPPPKTPGQKAFTDACNQTVARLFAQSLQEGKEVAFDIAFDPTAKALLSSLSLAPKADTPLARSLAEAGKRASIFAIEQPAQETHPLFVKVNVALPEAIAKSLAQLVEDGFLEGAANLRDADKKKQADDLLAALKPSLDAGEIDAILRLVGPGAGRKFGVIAGFKAKDADRLGGVFKSLVEDAKKQLTPAEQAKVTLDAEAVGALKIHRFVLPTDKGQLGKAPDVLGDSTLSLAFGSNAVFVGMGFDSLNALKNLATVSKAGPSRLASARIDVMQLAPLLTTSPKTLAALPTIFTQRADGFCSIEVSGGERLGVSMLIRTPVLRFLREAREEQGEEKK